MRQTDHKRINFKPLMLIAVCLIVVGIAGAWIVGIGPNTRMTLEDTADINGVTQVRIATQNQRVNVVATDAQEMRAISSGIPENATLVVEVNDSILTVETVWPRTRVINVVGFVELFNSIHAQPTLTVYLPTNLYEQVTINSTNGNIEISGFEIDDLQIETTNARVAVADMTGDLNARTTNGRITASDIVGENVRARTTNGGIEVSDVMGDIDAQTTNGRITLTNETIEQNVSLQSSNGRIEVSLSREPDHAAFDLETTNGRTEIFGNRNTTQAFGDGRYEVRLRTTNGNITVE